MWSHTKITQHSLWCTDRISCWIYWIWYKLLLTSIQMVSLMSSGVIGQWIAGYVCTIQSGQSCSSAPTIELLCSLITCKFWEISCWNDWFDIWRSMNELTAKLLIIHSSCKEGVVWTSDTPIQIGIVAFCNREKRLHLSYLGIEAVPWTSPNLVVHSTDECVWFIGWWNEEGVPAAGNRGCIDGVVNFGIAEDVWAEKIDEIEVASIRIVERGVHNSNLRTCRQVHHSVVGRALAQLKIGKTVSFLILSNDSIINWGKYWN